MSSRWIATSGHFHIEKFDPSRVLIAPRLTFSRP
jgi:hypothetical protein